MGQKTLTGYPSVDKPWLKYYSKEAIEAVSPKCTVYQNIYDHNKEHLEDEVLKSIQKKAESIMPKDAKVILFGSRARRDAKADSDWDILVLLNKDKIDEQDHDNYTYPLWELGWQINQMIHPIVYSMKDWNSKKGSPFYNNVEEEGVMVLQNSGTP